MDNEAFDRVSEVLFNGIESIGRIGSPGILIPVSKDTRAVLCGVSTVDVIIVAARFGQGRCLIFGHNGYLNLFTGTQQTQNYETFANNCKQWVSQGSSNDILDISNIVSMAEIDTNGKILLWNGHTSKTDEFMNDLLEHLQAGGSLLCGSTTWGWLQGNKNKTLSDFSFARFCDNLGVKLTKSIANCPDPISFQSELIKYKNIQQAIEDLNENPNEKHLYAIIGAAVKEIEDISSSNISIENLENMIKNATQDMIPDHKCPIKDKTCREQSQGLCNMICRMPGIKAPGVNNFPGDFNEIPEFVSDVTCTIESNTKQWYCTGYYVAAGTTIQIDMVEQTGTNGWTVRIGCHSDDLKNCNEYHRWNCISMCKTLTNECIEMCSPFGGLLFLESPDDNDSSNSITINIHRVVLAPTYNLSEENRAETWNYQKENAQGLWADISGKYIVFNLPSTSVRHLDSEQLDKALNYWDSVVLAHHDLVGTQPKRRERIVCDEQPRAGYMHAGYPIVTHMDVSDPKNKNFLFNIDTLEKEGAWGLFHELGHNRQRPSWTFEGTGEVTVNIFTLHAMDILCHQPIWIHKWLKDQLPDTKKYISNGSKFDEWKQKPGVALFIYAQLAREYGWENYKTIFRQYEQLNPQLNTNQEKIDYWITTFSRQVGHNLIPLFKFWGFPVAQSTIDELSTLETPKIDDELIQLAPERYTIA